MTAEKVGHIAVCEFCQGDDLVWLAGREDKSGPAQLVERGWRWVRIEAGPDEVAEQFHIEKFLTQPAGKDKIQFNAFAAQGRN